MDMSSFLVFLPLFVATLLGACIGVEREYKHKPAGIKTYALVSLGAALFIILGNSVFYEFHEMSVSFDPSRVLSAIVIGVGFIGGGLIVRRELEVEGITTATGVWIAAAVGTAVGLEMYELAIFTTLLTIFVFQGITMIEYKFIRRK